MAKRKVFEKTDLSTPVVEHSRDSSGTVMIRLEVVPPVSTKVRFGVHSEKRRSFDFSPWYGVDIDAITYACQIQIERFLAKQDGEITVMTVVAYCVQGLSSFLNFAVAWSVGLGRELGLSDLNRSLIDGYVGHLGDLGISSITQKSRYSCTKAVLKALCRRGLVTEILGGDEATFPRAPYPGVIKSLKGHPPLTTAQRKAFSVAVKTAVMPLFSDDVVVTSELLAYALLVVALHTGRNTHPLLEMTPDCLRAHPKNDTLFLVLYKRRGHSTSKVALRAEPKLDRGIESMPTLKPTVARLIVRVIALSDRLRNSAPEHLRNRVWLYRRQTVGHVMAMEEAVTNLSSSMLETAIKKLVKNYRLVDGNGKPLRVNVSTLRKTFVNRLFEILEGDVVSTAAATGDSVAVTSKSYLRPNDDSQRNWKFMGLALVQELLTDTLGATERTPVGQCSDAKNGQYAPKRDGASCMDFLNCLRCRNYVVTADDLHRLFSFYWRILSERSRIDRRRWKQQLGHIVRLIDRDVVAAGLAAGIFKPDVVNAAREQARHNPHPFWKTDSILCDISEIGE